MFTVIHEVRDLGTDLAISHEMLFLDERELRELELAADRHNNREGRTSREVFVIA